MCAIGNYREDHQEQGLSRTGKAIDQIAVESAIHRPKGTRVVSWMYERKTVVGELCVAPQTAVGDHDSFREAGRHVHFLTRTPSPKIIAEAFATIRPALILAVPLIIDQEMNVAAFVDGVQHFER